jgi:pimeloyl-ACP methyl ester carboxylesterase
VKRRWVIVGVSAVAVLGLIYFATAWIIVGQALEAEVSKFDHHPADFDLTFEEVEFNPRGEDEITLRGWWFPVYDSVGSIILVHGLDSNRAERLPLLKDLTDFGLDVLSFDLRGHGESDKVQIGAGFFETEDVHGAIDFLLDERGVEPGTVLLMGHSFGAAIVLMAAVGEDAVAAVYADSAFASLSEQIVDEVSDRTLIPSWGASLLRPAIIWVGSTFKGVKIDEVEPVEAIGQIGLAVGLTHCREDDRIPFTDMLRLRTAAPGGSFFVAYPDCEHADAYDAFAERYVITVAGYFYDMLGLVLP